MTDTIEDFKKRYANATTQKKRAELELECWDKFKDDASRTLGTSRHEFVGAIFGVDAYHVRSRVTLLRYGSWAAKLWPLIDDTEISLTGALQIGLATKLRKRADETYEAALDREIAQWAMSRQYPRVSTGLKRSRKGSGERAERPTRKHHENASGGQAETGTDRETAFRKSILEACCAYVTEKLVGFDDFEKNIEIEWFGRELKVLFEQLYARIRARDQQHGSVQISRRRFLGACHVLRVAPPKKADKAWKSRVARPQMKRMAREYHPDQTKGATEAQFNAVMEAWRVIDKYGDAEEKGEAE